MLPPALSKRNRLRAQGKKGGREKKGFGSIPRWQKGGEKSSPGWGHWSRSKNRSGSKWVNNKNTNAYLHGTKANICIYMIYSYLFIIIIILDDWLIWARGVYWWWKMQKGEEPRELHLYRQKSSYRWEKQQRFVIYYAWRPTDKRQEGWTLLRGD